LQTFNGWPYLAVTLVPFRRKSPAGLNPIKQVSFFGAVAAAYEDLHLVSTIPFSEADAVRI
jgi:hypothetical protein